ncbi:MAG TPA: serine/threonine-protein kinase [Anaeromyxobacteraceae bacterium]|nr:serine/threonine-protein kinase [Anaeromyxobacteraceae bacterium]
MGNGSNVDIRTAPIEVAVGSELGSYELVSLLGEGAMGRVFKARHVKLGRSVAIKVLNPEYAARPDIVKRFFREARVVNEISHEHIVEVTDFVEVPGLAFLVMELLDGESLRGLLKRRKGKWPPVRRIVSVMAQVCDALAAAHDKGVVHRDLKPDNVFVIKRAGGDYAKVLDFGIAKLKDQSDSGGPGSTVTGMILGTPLYMSPEQAMGKEVGPASDVWAAGVVLYELLSGNVPFKAGNFVDLVQKIRTEPAPPLPLRTPRRERIPLPLAATVMKCLEKNTSDRHRSMDALSEALRVSAGISGRGWNVPWKGLAAAAALLAVGYVAWRSDLLRKAKPLAGRVGSEVTEAARTASSAVSGAVSATPEVPRPKPVPREHAPPRPAAAAKESRPEPAPARHARATHPATVDLDVRSSPMGAKVVRLDTGELLGRTPLRLKFYQKQRAVALRFTLDGYEPAKASASLKSDGRVSVALRKSPRRRR